MSALSVRRGFRDVHDWMAVLLGVFAYMMLVIVDLTTTTVLLRFYPWQAKEVNALPAAVLERFGFAGLWFLKLGAAWLVLGLYLILRARHARGGMRKVVDGGLVASCGFQAAVVLLNLQGFAALAL